MTKKTLVIYHNSCMDGSVSAALSVLAEGVSSDVYTMSLNYPHDGGDCVDAFGVNIVDKIVDFGGVSKIMLVDFSIPPSQVAELFSMVGGDIYIFDHHDAYKREDVLECGVLLDGFKEWVESERCVFKSNWSGSKLVFDYFRREVLSNVPFDINPFEFERFVQMINDRDTWVRKNKEAFSFHEAVSGDVLQDERALLGEIVRADESSSGCFKITEKIKNGFNDWFKRSLDIGDALVLYRDDIIVNLVKLFAVVHDKNDLVPCGYVTMDCPRSLVDETSEYMRSVFPQSSLFLFLVEKGGSDYMAVSVRSRNGTSLARNFARRFNGGGHPDAAGCYIERSVYECITKLAM
ncbi:DHHA1 domain-containing protein [Photobacterium kishitanii]|uniref:DHHA1 domain-containing protein n=1 Tax=Photobacterium kishitanii TaxID=318456 RepID=UPI0011B2219F|nr:DHHA1 domain-containing protein [Photobacterium kishitanii]